MHIAMRWNQEMRWRQDEDKPDRANTDAGIALSLTVLIISLGAGCEEVVQRFLLRPGAIEFIRIMLPRSHVA
jgi:hypothetical protein